MKKQIYEKANKTPHTARRSIGPELPQADPLMIASPRQSRKREGSISFYDSKSIQYSRFDCRRYNFIGFFQIRVWSIYKINVFGTVARRKIIWLNVFSYFEGFQIIVCSKEQDQVRSFPVTWLETITAILMIYLACIVEWDKKERNEKMMMPIQLFQKPDRNGQWSLMEAR